MAAGTILYVGNDICHRIDVMERSGFDVLHCDCAIGGFRDAFAEARLISAITFGNAFHSPLLEAASTARTLSAAPLVLFEDPAIKCHEHAFDLVIPAHTPPADWLRSLEELIEESRKLQELSRQMCEDCAATRASTRALRALSARNRISPIAGQDLWRGKNRDDSENPASGPAPPGDIKPGP
jgi:hypothetical protein